MTVRLFKFVTSFFLGFAVANFAWALHLKEKTKADEMFWTVLSLIAEIGWLAAAVLLWLV